MTENRKLTFAEKQEANKARVEKLLATLNQIAVFETTDVNGQKVRGPKKSPVTGENMTRFEVLLERNKVETDVQIQAHNFIWQALFVLSGRDKTVKKGSDIKIQYGYPPAFYRGKSGGWTADHRFPELTEKLIEAIHSYVTPKRVVNEMINDSIAQKTTIDYDYSLVLNMNVFYPEDKTDLKETDKGQFLFNVNQDFDAGYSLERFRVNLAGVMGRKMWIMRTIEAVIPQFEDLNLPNQVKQFASAPKGLFLVVGPTGSGKTTTLASLVDIINKTQNKNIITIEDPIEYVYTNKKSFISQREVHRDTESFASGTRAALREKPDIVYIGEMRDLETTRAALELAETGHFTIATLHTFNAAKTIDRIIKQFPTEEQNLIRFSLASALVGIVSQTLVPTLPDAQGNTSITPLNEVVYINQAAKANIQDEMIDSIIQSVAGDKRSLTMFAHAKELSITQRKVDPYLLLERFYHNDLNTYEQFVNTMNNAGIYKQELDPAFKAEREAAIIREAYEQGVDPNEALVKFHKELEEKQKNLRNELVID